MIGVDQTDFKLAIAWMNGKGGIEHLPSAAMTAEATAREEATARGEGCKPRTALIGRALPANAEMAPERGHVSRRVAMVRHAANFFSRRKREMIMSS